MPGYEGLRLMKMAVDLYPSFYIAVIASNTKTANNCPTPLLALLALISTSDLQLKLSDPLQPLNLIIINPSPVMEIIIKDNLESFTLNYLLQMQRRNSDLIETGLRKRTLTHTSSVNLPRTLSTSNLSRSISGSVTNLSKTSPRMVRSCSSSSFSAVELGVRSGRQDPLVKSQVSILYELKIK